MNEHIRAPGGWASVSDRFPVVVGSRQAAAVRATGRVGLGRFSPGGRLGRMFTSRECNKHRVLRDGSGHIFAFVPSSNGCKRLVAVAPQIGRRNSKRESSLWSGNWSVRWRRTSAYGSNWKKRYGPTSEVPRRLP